MSEPNFVVLYRWRIKPGDEQKFTDAWSIVTQSLLERGSLGSRLHRGDDGLWYSYAQWPSAETRRAAFEGPNDHADASKAMQDAIEEHFPEVVLHTTADFLRLT